MWRRQLYNYSFTSVPFFKRRLVSYLVRITYISRRHPVSPPRNTGMHSQPTNRSSHLVGELITSRELQSSPSPNHRTCTRFNTHESCTPSLRPTRNKTKWAFSCRPTVLTLGMLSTPRAEAMFGVTKNMSLEKKNVPVRSLGKS